MSAVTYQTLPAPGNRVGSAQPSTGVGVGDTVLPNTLPSKTVYSVKINFEQISGTVSHVLRDKRLCHKA